MIQGTSYKFKGTGYRCDVQETAGTMVHTEDTQNMDGMAVS